MKKKIDSKQLLEQFEDYLKINEKSAATIEKYRRDTAAFLRFAENKKITSELLHCYKAELKKTRTAETANSAIASVNSFLRFLGLQTLRIKPFKIQKKIYCPEERELTKAEYLRLVRAANERLSLLIQTVCGTGIRISELEFITLEAAKKGEAAVTCKGKNRVIFLIPELRKKLLRYAKKRGISSGPIFITKTRKPLNRSNVWKEMKRICETAKVPSSKVFPHNLRHLFARIFYALEKDIAKLADILGHSNINTTRIYLMDTGAEHRKRMEKMRLIL